MNATPVASASKEPMEEHEKFAKIQSDFWAEHRRCYVLGEESFKVDIKQCILAKDEYVIRKLEKGIVQAVMKELVQMGDAKSRQRLCVTPVSLTGDLLERPPKKWEDISKGRFMVINGQHSVEASRQLQTAGCGAARRIELRTWDAYVVWTLDAAKLTNISQFYNSINHLEHAQPTGGNQIISCRNIWISCKQPTNSPTEAVERQNGAVHDIMNYNVRE